MSSNRHTDKYFLHIYKQQLLFFTMQFISLSVLL